MELYLKELLEEKEKEAVARGLEQSLERGLEQGLEQGSRQTEDSYIREMKKEGIPVDVIARISGKTIEEIQSMNLL